MKVPVVYVVIILFLCMSSVGCATSTANPNIHCPLGQVAYKDKCENYTEMSEMGPFAKQIVDSIAEFAKAHDLPTPTQDMLQFVTSSNGDTSPCAPRPYESYASCFYEGRLYIGSAMLLSNFTDSGVLAPITIVAHEYGHYLQEVAGASETQLRPGTRKMVQHENQADCVSGAYVGWLGAQQQIKLSELVFLLNMIWSHGSNPYVEPNKVHGEPHERTAAFTTGYDDGIEACNSIGNQTIAE